MQKLMLNDSKINGYTFYSLAPVGTWIGFCGANIPTGWLLCDGRAVSRTDYAKLFAVIGTAYGIGDGSTTFNIPDFRDKVPQGANNNLGASIAAGLPNIKGGAGVNNDINNPDQNINGAFSYTTGNKGCSDSGTGLVLSFDASQYNPIYKDDCDTVQPPAVATNFIIKATEYRSSINENNIDDSRITTGNVWTAQKTNTQIESACEEAIDEAAIKANTYSETETVIGKWIDLKPVYRKVFIDPNNSWNASDNIIGNIADFKEPVTIKAIAVNSVLPGWLENNEGGSSRCYAYVKSNGEVHFYRADVLDGSSYPKRVIIEYTKTTD